MAQSFREILRECYDEGFLSNESVFREKYGEIMDQYWGILETLRQREEAERTVSSVKDSVARTVSDGRAAELAREILGNNRLHIFGQGIFDRSGKRVDDEVLVRGLDAEGKIVYPDELLGGVESIGHEKTLDWLIIENACIYVSQAGKHNETYGINVNPQTFMDPVFYPRIKALFEKYSVKPRNVILEILEYGSFPQEKTEEVDETFGKLRALGVQIAIDDYPSGGNTLSQVSTFKNIDIVKIDGIHVMEMFRTCYPCEQNAECVDLMEEGRARSDAMCLKDVDRDFKIETLVFSMRFLKKNYPHVRFFAERVEDADVFEFLRNFDLIEGFQGYHFEKPRLLASSERLREELLGADMESDALSPRQDAEEGAFVAVEPKARVHTELSAYMAKMEAFTSAAMEIHSAVPEGGLSRSISDPSMSKPFSEILPFLGGDRLTAYEVVGDSVVGRTVSADGSSVDDAVLPKTPSANRVEKRYVNLYRLLSGRHDVKSGAFEVSRVPVPGEGDDIVVKVSENLYVGLDDSDNAVFHSKMSQVNLLIMFVALAF